MIKKIGTFFSTVLFPRILVFLSLFAGFLEISQSSVIEEKLSSIERVDLIRQQLLEQDKKNQQYNPQQQEIKLTWYNWGNWPNWNNWGNWGNFPNWPNWPNY